MQGEQELELRLPCWVISEPVSGDADQAPCVTTMVANGKSIVQVFLEKDEADTFISKASLSGKVPFSIPTVQHLVGVMDHLQSHGVNEVHLFYQGETGINRADMEIAHFIEAIKGQMKIRRKKRT